LTYGVLAQPDAVLCASGKHIARSIQSVTEAAETARQQLQRVRHTLHAAIDRRIDDLVAVTSAAESAKISALESELEQLDGVLERMRREHEAARTAATTLDDDVFAAARGDMVTELDALYSMIAALSVGPVEPLTFHVDINNDALISAICVLGTVIAPRGVPAPGSTGRIVGSDIHYLRSRPDSTGVCPSAALPPPSPSDLIRTSVADRKERAKHAAVLAIANAIYSSLPDALAACLVSVARVWAHRRQQEDSPARRALLGDPMFLWPDVDYRDADDAMFARLGVVAQQARDAFKRIRHRPNNPDAVDAGEGLSCRNAQVLLSKVLEEWCSGDVELVSAQITCSDSCGTTRIVKVTPPFSYKGSRVRYWYGLHFTAKVE
jgi:hypothetical protein